MSFLYDTCLMGKYDIVLGTIKYGTIELEDFRRACEGAIGNHDNRILSLVYMFETNCRELHHACMKGDIETIKFMIKKGDINPNIGLQSACEKGDMEIVKLMIENGADYWDKALVKACIGGNIEIVKLMIEKDVDYFYKNKALMNACEEGHIEIVKLLIEKGANDLGLALTIACNKNNIELTKLIIEKRANHSNYYCKYWTIGLWRIYSMGNLEIIKFIKKKD